MNVHARVPSYVEKCSCSGLKHHRARLANPALVYHLHLPQ
ncbi:hypothetical protein CP97_00290 [Aurantiacibacter atlanticus]|uniref:Uncharacterized protein n=1 Tax=Aurantiacibacter atlanticus TaxID=1648404 RepID=A0A0H4VDA1_9SPHN|nr:hypothetical protein CP97_00290 [Aurantiacibacter atlanticus]